MNEAVFKQLPPPRTKRVLFQAVVRLRRAGGQNDWIRSTEVVDPNLLKRLFPRVAYGGKKGWRAFCRLWAAGVRPGEPISKTFRLAVKIKGFELSDSQWFALREVTP
jgi:hypothetical protein